jgi:HD-GYP domain-containing protein (c-di-GMP phosphodiesterase class II)
MLSVPTDDRECPPFGQHSANGLDRLKLKQLEEDFATMETGVMCALNMVLDLKDLRTGLHATRLAEWAVRVGERLGVGPEELRDIERASLLHDIGKIGVPDEVLFKPGRLTEEETEQARRHPEYGWAILKSVPGFERASLLVLHHHERYDGAGYPAGLAGEEIPLGARIVGVVDAYDAMISDRAYRKGLPHEEAVRRLEADAGSQFDPNVTPLFVRMTGQTQTGEAFEEEIPSYTHALAASQR